MQSLRELIRIILKEEVLGEPDESAEDEREEGHHEQSVAGIAGAVPPLGTGPTYPDDIKKSHKKRLSKKNKN